MKYRIISLGSPSNAPKTAGIFQKIAAKILEVVDVFGKWRVREG
jgi:hypothetical protein